METLFEGIDLGEVSTSMTINATAAILLALYATVARRHGVDPHRLRGTTQNDILKEYIARGTYIYPPEPSMRLVTDTFAYCHAELPAWNTISISGYHMHPIVPSSLMKLMPASRAACTTRSRRRSAASTGRAGRCRCRGRCTP